MKAILTSGSYGDPEFIKQCFSLGNFKFHIFCDTDEAPACYNFPLLNHIMCSMYVHLVSQISEFDLTLIPLPRTD